MSRTVAVRLLPGASGETRRQAHLAEAPTRGRPKHWTTHCGLRIPDEATEVSQRPAGMPCLVCLFQLTVPTGLDATYR